MGGIMMNIYDFDKTIYDGDCSLDFIKYCFKTNKKTLFIVPKIIFFLFLYMIKLCEKEDVKSVMFKIVTYFDNIDDLVDYFWKENENKIKKFYKKNKKKSDIIITGSPTFLINPIAKKFKFKLIGTEIDLRTGKVIGNNCYGEEKVNRLKKINIYKCNYFYSDSLNDTPLANISKKAYIVKGEELILWNKYKNNKIKEKFINRDFFTYLFIGGINVFNGVIFAYIYSLFINDPIISFIIGFITSLSIAYILNSILNFKQKLTIKKYALFAINNIYNFIIQVITVILLINKFELNKILSYFISAAIAVPITFLLVKNNVFKEVSYEKK